MYEFASKVRYSETDSEGKLSLEALLDYFQDCSTFHSEELHLGVEYLKQYDMAWVLSSWQIVVERYPQLCEKITIGTFPYDFKGFLGYRNFLMRGEDGEVLAKANTLWTLVNITNMRPCKPTEAMLEGYTLEPKLDMEYAPRKIVIPEDGETQEAIIVRRHHLDTNYHVNNGQYIRMAMDFLPDGYEIKQLRAEYKKSALLHDIIYPLVAEKDGVHTVSLRDGEGKPYTNVEFS